MTSTEQLLQHIDEILHPRSVAIVGVPRGMKTGKLFFMAILDQGFSGEIYPVSPQADEIDGFKAYPSVAAIPGAVDLAIILVPQHLILSAVKECAAKGVRVPSCSRRGTRKQVPMRDAPRGTASSIGPRFRDEAHRAELHGHLCATLRTFLLPAVDKRGGSRGARVTQWVSGQHPLSHSPQRGIRFSKAISLGNECDLTSADFLLYLGNDAETRLIGAYIEGIKDGPRFFDALRTASLKKPVILWKPGLTSAGAQAAAFHTGALAVARDVWEGVVKQTGAVPVVGVEAWFDALMGFAMLPEHLGDRIAIVSGPGGLAVSAAEACADNGLRLAQLSPKTHASWLSYTSDGHEFAQPHRRRSHRFAGDWDLHPEYSNRSCRSRCGCCSDHRGRAYAEANRLYRSYHRNAPAVRQGHPHGQPPRF